MTVEHDVDSQAATEVESAPEPRFAVLFVPVTDLTERDQHGKLIAPWLPGLVPMKGSGDEERGRYLSNQAYNILFDDHHRAHRRLDICSNETRDACKKPTPSNCAHLESAELVRLTDIYGEKGAGILILHFVLHTRGTRGSPMTPLSTYVRGAKELTRLVGEVVEVDSAVARYKQGPSLTAVLAADHPNHLSSPDWLRPGLSRLLAPLRFSRAQELMEGPEYGPEWWGRYVGMGGGRQIILAGHGSRGRLEYETRTWVTDIALAAVIQHEGLRWFSDQISRIYAHPDQIGPTQVRREYYRFRSGVWWTDVTDHQPEKSLLRRYQEANGLPAIAAQVSDELKDYAGTEAELAAARTVLVAASFTVVAVPASLAAMITTVFGLTGWTGLWTGVLIFVLLGGVAAGATSPLWRPYLRYIGQMGAKKS